MRLLTLLAGALSCTGALGCSLVLDFDRFRDAGGDATVAPDAGAAILTARCGDDGVGCILQEGLGTGERTVAVEIRASSAIFDSTASVTAPPLAPLLIGEIRPPSGASDVLGIALRIPIAETRSAGSESVDLTVSIGGVDLAQRVTITVEFFPELNVPADSVITGTGIADLYSNVEISATASLRATGAAPLLLRVFGDVHLGSGASLNADGLPGALGTGTAGPGSGGGEGGEGGLSGAAGLEGIGLGAGLGGATGAPGVAGGGAGHGVGGTPALLGGPVYGTGMLEPFTAMDAAGSGGGGGGAGTTGGGGYGGHGGGALRILTDGSIVVDPGASVSADGSPGVAGAGDGGAGGGGSGGGVWLSAGEGIRGLSGTVRAVGGVGSGGTGGSGFVRIDAPGIIEPGLTPIPLYTGLRWDSAIDPIVTASMIDVTLWGDPNAAVEIEVDDGRGGLRTTTGLVIGAGRSVSSMVLLSTGWNRLRACSPTCAAATDGVEDLTVVYVP